MRLNDIEADCIVIDLETLATLLIIERDNSSVSLLMDLIDCNKLITSAETRSRLKDYSDSDWMQLGLSGIIVMPLDRDIQDTISSMVDTCRTNGIDVRNPGVQPKLVLVAIALMNDASVVSVDVRDTPYAMSHICSCFNVPFIDARSLEH